MAFNKNINIHNHVASSEYVDWQLPLAFDRKRHVEKIEGTNTVTQTWRMKERMKTVSVALVLCLNVGVDPPDIVKTQPCARLECWIDPLAQSPQKSLEAIGNSLQRQYERWQPRARYKQTLDPTAEEVKKLCTSLRKNSKEERVLFHYNGHGVPKPTANGEIWVFNKNYTQYIPLSVYDLQTWMGAPSIYVYDCSNAGIIVESFKQFAEQHEREFEQHAAHKPMSHSGSHPPSFKNCIQLAACAHNQILSMNPDLPADLFTSCLTTPIKIALQWYCMQNTVKLVPVSLDIIDKIPGQLNDRRTMLGELNWIFTAITDTIAWNTLPRDLFQKLFRQDLLVASLFRNFLLAERIMRSYDCTPVSSPKLPPTYQHPMWQAWDLALDICLSQLPAILEKKEQFCHSPFFEEQLTAFQVWLSFGSELRNPPEQLPIVLQVLLSQVHRLRALDLLGRFLDLGPWAVNLALSVGIFPYVLKLLQSSARELRPLLVFIWAKILALDSTCQADLVRDNGHRYFLSVLQDPCMPGDHRTMATFVLACIVSGYPAGQEAATQGNLISICLDQINDSNPLLRQWLALCLGKIWTNYDSARWTGVRDVAHDKLSLLLTDTCSEVRAAAVYALGTFISSVSERSEHANTIDHSISVTLVNIVGKDGSALVRKELVVALQWMVLIFESSFITIALLYLEEVRMKDSSQSPPQGVLAGGLDLTLSPTGGLKRIASRDRIKYLNSPIAQSGSTSQLSSSPENVINEGMHHSMSTTSLDRMRRVTSTSSVPSLGYHGTFSSVSALPFGSIYMKLWQGLLNLEKDPHPDVARMAKVVTDYIKMKAKETTIPKEVVETRTQPGSMSAPASPSSKPTFIAGESPPANSVVRDTLRTAPCNLQPSRIRKNMPNTISEDAEEVPGPRQPLVTTQFVEWSCRHFAQPCMNAAQEEDLESAIHKEKDWKYMRNAQVRREIVEQRQLLHTRIDEQIFINKNVNIPSLIMFHPYDSHIAVADKDYYSIWNWEKGTMVSYNCNNNPKETRITAMDFINSHDVTLLLLGSDDGAVRLWKHYTAASGEEPLIISAWQALPEIVPSTKGTRGAGMVLAWGQESQQLYVTGDVLVIRIWDVEKELKVQDIPTGADSCVTSVSCENGDGNALIVTGFGDGTVRLYDRRLAANESRVMTWREHSSWVVQTHFQNRADSSGKIISGCVAGDVKVYDPRMNKSLMTCQTSQGMTSMAIHPTAEIFACGSFNQFISVYRTDGEIMNVIKYYDGFIGQRIGPVSCLAFHPDRMHLGAGSTDSYISVYSMERKR